MLGYLFRSNSKQVSKRNLMLFIRPSIIRDRDQYRHASSEKYQAFNQEQDQQRGKQGSAATLNNEVLKLPPDQNGATFRQVNAAISAFYSTGGR
ncbi:Type II secretion system protein D precursor [compost metagenome]